MTTKTRIRKITLGLTLMTLLTVVAGYAAVATTNFRPPTVVVTFNIERVTADLTERADSEVRLKELVTTISDESDRRIGAIQELRAGLEEAPQAEQTAIMEQLDQLTLEAMSYQRFVEMRIDNERSLMFRDLYLKIQSAVADIATENGYDLVIISDDDREILVNPNANKPREFQVREQIELQRVVFSSSQIDITDQIVTHMNLEWEKRADQ